MRVRQSTQASAIPRTTTTRLTGDAHLGGRHADSSGDALRRLDFADTSHRVTGLAVHFVALSEALICLIVALSQTEPGLPPVA